MFLLLFSRNIHAIFIRDIKYLWVIFVLFSENIAEYPFGLNKDRVTRFQTFYFYNIFKRFEVFSICKFCFHLLKCH